MNNIYLCKDGRIRIYDKETKKVLSYPKYLMEHYLGRPLKIDEEVHHKDGNPLNNDLSNLEIRHHGEHQKEHSTKYHDRIEICQWCGKEFLWTSKEQRIFYTNRSRSNKIYSNNKPFCSKSCCGSFNAARQYKHAGVME